LSALTVAVVGGGITGLSAAWELSSKLPSGSRMVMVESEPRLGGKLRSIELGGRLVDVGPDAFLARRPEAHELCEEVGLGPELVHPSADRAYVWSRGALRPLPRGLALGVPTRLGPLARSGICSASGLGRAALDLLGPSPSGRRRLARDDASVGSIVRRRLGEEIHERLADPLVGGIHAGRADDLSAAAVFPQLLLADERPGSLMRALRSAPQDAERARPVFTTVRGGLARLAQRIGELVQQRGVEVRLGTTVYRLEHHAAGDGAAPGAPEWSLATSAGGIAADGVVIAVPAPAASEILGALDPSFSGLLGGIPYASVTIVTLRFPREAFGSSGPDLEGTGFLVPATEGRLLSACTWLSSKWRELHRPGDVLLRASAGRYGDERPGEMTDDELVARAVGELSSMLGVRGAPLDAVVTRWPSSFPQYLVGHLGRIEALEQAVARRRGLALAGAALHGIGVPACIGGGRRAAQQVVGALAATEQPAR